MKTEKYAQDKFTIDELIRRSWNLRDSRDFTKFIKFIAKFHHYSRFNCMLMYLQNEEVDFFGSVAYWKKKFKDILGKPMVAMKFHVNSIILLKISPLKMVCLPKP